MANVTIVDVAKHAGTSISTVSRFLKDPEKLKPVLAAKISLAIQELKYVPNSFARNLKRGSSDMIGVVCPDISQHYFSHAIKAINEILFVNGYMLMVCDSCFQPRKEKLLISRLIEQNVSGMLVATTGKNTDFLMETSKHFPNIILLDREEKSLNLDSFAEDNEENAYRLTQSVILKGARKIAVMTGVSYTNSTSSRVAGIYRAIIEAKLKLDSEDVHFGGTCIRDLKVTSDKILDCGRYDAIIFTIPRSIHAITASLHERQRKMNLDFYVAGWSYKESMDQQFVKFPAILQDAEAMGIRAANRMLQRLESKNKMIISERFLLGVELYVPELSGV